MMVVNLIRRIVGFPRASIAALVQFCPTGVKERDPEG